MTDAERRAMTERDRVQFAARLMLSLFEQMGHSPGECRAKVLAALHDCGTPLRGDEVACPMEVDGQEDYAVSAPGIFRLVANEHNVNPLDPYVQERWAKWVKNAIGGTS